MGVEVILPLRDVPESRKKKYRPASTALVISRDATKSRNEESVLAGSWQLALEQSHNVVRPESSMGHSHYWTGSSEVTGESSGV